MKTRDIIAICLSMLLVSSCITQKKQQRIAKAYMHDHPVELAELCAIHFKPQTLYKEGETIHTSDTTYLPGDSIPCPPYKIIRPDDVKGYVQYVQCPPSKIIRDTIWRTDTLTVPDLAAIAVLQDKVNELDKENAVFQADNDRLKKLAGTRLWWIIGLSVGLAGTGYLLFRRGI